MDELKNYIFYSICEKSYDLFEKTSYYSTYVNFCAALKNSIELDRIDYEDSNRVVYILDYLKEIYGLEYDESGGYVKDFFLLEKYKDFERPVRLIREYFSNSLN
jgi:hypothetical protein